VPLGRAAGRCCHLALLMPTPIWGNVDKTSIKC
jgi:hypothetical protein